MSYNSKYKGNEVEEILDSVSNKVDKVVGKQLSTEDFTTLLKEKLEGLNNYDDTELTGKINTLQTAFDALVGDNASSSIESFNEIIAFLEGIEDSQDLDSIIASIEQQIATVADSVPQKTSELENDSGFLNSPLDILKAVYPIGSIYMSVSNVSPSTLFGFGEWEQVKDSFLLGAGDTYAAGATGGEATHTLSVDEMPSHTHKPTTKTVNHDEHPNFSFSLIRDPRSSSIARIKVDAGDTYDIWAANPKASDYVSTGDINYSGDTAPTGGGAAFNNMPPYIAVYIWKRIS